MKVVLYAASSHGRSAHIACAMQEGMKRHGISAGIETRMGDVVGDVAIAYGWVHEPVFKEYLNAGAHYAYFDLGYWNRIPAKDKGGSREGAYRLSVNSWDTSDHMARGCPSDRFDASGLELYAQVVDGGPILIAGMSGKAAGTHNWRPGQWERETLEFVTQLTGGKCEIITRPKVSKGTPIEPIENVLARCSLAVMHHSNVAVDALFAGVPVWSRKGVGRLCSYTDLGAAISLKGPALSIEVRRALLSDIAYAQWTPAEMRSGHAWDHIKGLIDDYGS